MPALAAICRGAGASSVAQLEDTVASLETPDFDDGELAEIDQYAVDGALNIWASSSDAQ